MLGDKYGMPQFQDEVMMELLCACGQERLSWNAALEIFSETRGEEAYLDQGGKLAIECGKLRKLAAEEVAGSIRDGTKRYQDLNDFDGFKGFTSELWAALDRHHSYSLKGNERPFETHRLLKTWDLFMVGSGPYRHWIFEIMEIAENTTSTKGRKASYLSKLSRT
jgi:hypothetical protein